MAKTKKWKDPKTGTDLVLGQLITIDAATRLGPSTIGLFTITGFIDEGIRCRPSFDHGYGVQEITVLPEDIVLAGLKPL